MAGDQQHIHDPAKAEEFARALGLQIGGAGHPFVGNWGTKGLYAYRSGQYSGMAYFGTGGTERNRLDMPHESDKYRPWNRYDPDIPPHIREKLIELEDDESTSIAQPPQAVRTEPSRGQPARPQPSVEPSSSGILQGEISLKGVHGKYLSAQPDGRAEWNRDHASDWEHFHLEKRQGGKIALKGAHGMYVSAQTNGTVQINRREAPPGGWEEFTVEDRGNNVICLKSYHGKYLSAQPDGRAEWNRDHAPRGGWEEIRFVPQVTQNQQSTPAQNQEPAPASLEEPIEILEAVTGKPVRFKINNRPSSNDAWVGIYPLMASDQDHGEENKRWKWLRKIDVNNASFPKQSEGDWSIRVFSDGGHTLHARKDFDVKPAGPVDPAVLESSRRSALIALFIGMILLAPGIPLFIIGLGEGLSEGMSSASLEIEDGDGQGDLGWGIYIEGSLVDYNSNGIYDHCENIFVNATHSGSWMSDPWTGYQNVNPPDESRQVFEPYCGHTDPVEQRHHEGRMLIKIGQACHGCMDGTTTITIQNQNGDVLSMWIQNEEKKEVLGMLIPGAIFMGIGGFMFIVSLFVLLKMGFKSNATSSSKRGAGAGITLLSMGFPLLIIGSTSTGGDKLAMLVPGAVMFGIGAFVAVVAAIRMGATSVVRTEAEGNTRTRIEVLSFNQNQPIRFRINNPPPGNSAWVGAYPDDAGDREHDDRWRWLRDIDVDNATLPGQSKGKWSIRLFSDGGYTLHERTDFEILEGYKNEVWMKNARIEDSRIKGDMIDHPTFGNMNRRTSPIIKRTKHGNMHRFETNNTTYLIKDEDLRDEVDINDPFWR